MMLPTHALVGMVFALPVVFLAPEFATVALTGGLLGGVLPDADMYAGHRKTLHFPVYYSVLGVLATVVAVLTPSTLTVGAALLFVAAALHSVTDAFGGGLELRPWEGTSQRAVYNHYHGRWLPPRRWVRYDGAPEDFVLTAAVAVPLWVTVEAPFRWVVLAAVVVAAVYTLVRRSLPRIAFVLFGEVLPRYAPAPVLSVVPDRYRSGPDGDATA